MLVVFLISEVKVISSKGRHLLGVARVEKEVHQPLILGLDLATLLLLAQEVLNSLLDGYLLLSDAGELLLANTVLLDL